MNDKSPGWQFWIDRGCTFTDLVSRRPDGSLANYDILGYVVVAAMAITILMMYFIHRLVNQTAPAR